MQGSGRSGHAMWLGLDSAMLVVGLSRRSAAARTELQDAEDLLDAIEEAFNDRLQQEGQQSAPRVPSHVPSNGGSPPHEAVAAWSVDTNHEGAAPDQPLASAHTH
jgi:hypothetical protein